MDLVLVALIASQWIPQPLLRDPKLSPCWEPFFGLLSLQGSIRPHRLIFALGSTAILPVLQQLEFGHHSTIWSFSPLHVPFAIGSGLDLVTRLLNGSTLKVTLVTLGMKQQDALSWAAVAQWVPSQDLLSRLPDLFLLGLHSSAHQWLWFLEHSLQGRPGAPAVDVHGFHFPLALPFDTVPCSRNHPLISRQNGSASQGPRHETPFTLRCGTANVLTLQSKDSEHALSILHFNFSKQKCTAWDFKKPDRILPGTNSLVPSMCFLHLLFEVLVAFSFGSKVPSPQRWVLCTFDLLISESLPPLRKGSLCV